MKKRDLSAQGSAQNIEKKVNEIIHDIEYIEQEIKKKKKTANSASRSVKAISKELKVLGDKNKVKFTQSPRYLAGKRKLLATRKKHQQEKSLENLLNVIDEKDPLKHSFLTSEMMEKDTVHTALKQRRRNFGFAEMASYSPEPEISSKFLHPLSNKKSVKDLKKILYNHQFLVSPLSQRQFIRKEVDRGNIKSESPVSKDLMKSLSPFNRSRWPWQEENEDFDLSKNYQHIIKKTDMEVAVKRVRLSKLLNFKGAFIVTNHII